VAEWFNRRGVAAFVLKYRLAPRYRQPAPLLDAQRAVRWVRANAESLGVKTDRIGVMGFSAGGHLASTVGTRFDAGRPDAADPVERAGCRPDFLILCYPVISMEPPVGHAGSRNNLLGPNPPAELVERYSSHRRVTRDTPPTFLFHTTEDAGVVPENSILFYQACVASRVPAELHIYANGKHGIGLAAGVPGTSAWPDRMAEWMSARGLLPGR
jgi:acetyl esterase/lipase